MRTPNRTTQYVDAVQDGGRLVFRIPVSQNTRPGMKGELVLYATPWNTA